MEVAHRQRLADARKLSGRRQPALSALERFDSTDAILHVGHNQPILRDLLSTRADDEQRQRHGQQACSDGDPTSYVPSHRSNYNSTKRRFVYFGIYPGNAPDKRNAQRRRFTANTTRR